MPRYDIYDIFAIADDAQLTLRRGVAGDPRELAAARLPRGGCGGWWRPRASADAGD